MDLSCEELVTFFHQAVDLLAVLDRRGDVLAASPSAHRILGHSASALEGAELRELLHPDDLHTLRSLAKRLLSDGIVPTADLRLRHADGPWIPMRWSLAREPESGRIHAIGREIPGGPIPLAGHEGQEEREFRKRIGIELHDGILQVLTAGGMKLELARRLLRSGRGGAEAVLDELAELLTAEYREVRMFVDELNLEEPLATGEWIPLPDRIAALLRRLSSIWEVSTHMEGELPASLGPAVDRTVLRILQEAAVNASRHGGATEVRVQLSTDADALTLQIEDDGHGFPFMGDFDHEALLRKRLGPISLKRRIRDAGGTIAIRSTPQGAQLRIRLPLAPTATGEGAVPAGASLPPPKRFSFS